MVPGPRGTRRAPPPGPAQKGHVEFGPKAGWGLVLGHFLPWCPNGGIATGCQMVVTTKPAHLQPGEKSKPANKSSFGGLTKFPRACSWLWLWQRLPQPHGRQSQSEEFPSLKQKPRESSWRGWANTGEASSTKPMANNPSLPRRGPPDCQHPPTESTFLSPSSAHGPTNFASHPLAAVFVQLSGTCLQVTAE